MQVPTSVIWGYFAFMALDSLPGSQFWERLLLLFTDPSRRVDGYCVFCGEADAHMHGHHPFKELHLSLVYVLTKNGIEACPPGCTCQNTMPARP